MEIKGHALIDLREKIIVWKWKRSSALRNVRWWRLQVCRVSVDVSVDCSSHAPSADGALLEEPQHTANITQSAILW